MLFNDEPKKEKKQNKVVSILDYLNNFKGDVKRTNVKNKIKSLELDNQLLDMEIENMDKVLEHEKKTAKQKYRKSLKNNFLICLLVWGGCLSSIILTPMGFGLINNISEGINEVIKGNTGNSIVSNLVLSSILTVILMLIGVTSFYYTSIHGQIHQYFYKLKPLITVIAIISIPISIVGNWNMLHRIMNFTNTKVIDNTITLLICTVLDLSVIAGLRLIHDKKYKNYTYQDDFQDSDKLTLWNMIQTLTIDTMKLKFMDRFYNRRKEINSKYQGYNLQDIKKINGKDIGKLPESTKQIDNNKKSETLEPVDNRQKKPKRQTKKNNSKKDYNNPTGDGKNNVRNLDIETVKKYIENLKNIGETKIVINKLLEKCNIKKDRWQEIRKKFDKENIVNYDKNSKTTYIL
jgi:hypothetical protein